MAKRSGQTVAAAPALRASAAPEARVSLAARLLDGLLLSLLVAVAVLLGCYEMGDTDVWWHLRGGQWILEHGRPPGLDPFTFGSADRRWIDIHWLYEVVLALTYRAGGVGALVLLAAGVGGFAFLVVLLARRRQWPVAVTVLCWLPALVLFAFRLDPRPEIFSLLYLGCFLAVLWRAEERPALLWLLVPLQILWVNMQGLFVLGPVLLSMFLAARGARLLWARQGSSPPSEERRWWKHAGGAALAVAVACLVNPYFLDGARFPFDLYPKVSEANNIYKRYIDELKSARDFVEESTPRVAGANGFFLACYLLMLLLPVSFLYPALWRAWKATAVAPRPAVWFGGLAAVLSLLALSAFTLSGRGPGWLLGFSDNVALLLLPGGALGAVLLSRRCPEAAALAAVGGAAQAVLLLWLQAKLLGEGRGLLGGTTAELTGPLVLAGLASAALVLRWEGSLFRGLVAGAFAYLALQALQNWTRFALVAGTVLSWNFGEWAVEVARAGGTVQRRAAAWGMRVGLAGVLGLWVGLLVTDRYYPIMGEVRHLSLREQPLEFAHDAVRFAGQRGLPERALVFGLGQTGLYVFHNAPRCKPFMDGRLEMPARRTFETYVNLEQWLRTRDRRWREVVADMGDPLILLEHQNNYGAEALLLTDPDWRCIYFDALAAVFVRRGRADEKAFPSVDFAARHFSHPRTASVPEVRGAARRELKALSNLAASVPRTPATAWRWRIPILLNALDRGQLAWADKQAEAEVWVLLGNCYWNLIPNLREKPPGPADPWRLERCLAWSQATYCFRRAVAGDPKHASAWRALAQCYRVRDMTDAQLAAAGHWLDADPKATAEQRKQLERQRKLLDRVRLPLIPPGQVYAVAVRLIGANRPALAAKLIDDHRDSLKKLSWPLADRLAGLYMHLGRPADARRVWQQARGCPSEAARLCRLAATFWVERDFESALSYFRQARRADPKLGDACWGLAVLSTQLGDARAVAKACDAGRTLSLSRRQRSDLETFGRFLEPRRRSP